MIPRVTAVLICILSASASSASPNLLANPGFEEGTAGWQELWLREKGSGTAVLWRESAHDGNVCLRIEHRGEGEWRYQPLDSVPVAPGDILWAGGWMRAESVAGRVQLSVAFRNSKGDSLAGSPATTTITGDHDWKLYPRRVMAGHEATTAVLQVSGTGPAVVYIDDLFLRNDGSVSECREKSGFRGLQFGNRQLAVRVASDLSMEVLDKRTGYTWTQQVVPAPWIVCEARTYRAGATLWLYNVLSGSKLNVALRLREQRLDVTLDCRPDTPVEEALQFPFCFMSRPGDYVIFPEAREEALPAIALADRREIDCGDHDAAPRWCGITDMKSGWMLLPVLPAGGKISIYPVLTQDGPRAGAQMVWEGKEEKWTHPRRVNYLFIADGGPEAMSAYYCEWTDREGYPPITRN